MNEESLTRSQCCIKCGVSKPLTLDFFHHHPKMANGFLGCCRTCRQMYRKAEYQRNRPQAIADTQNWYNNNKEHKRQYDARYRKDNRDRILAYHRKWISANRDRVQLYNVKAEGKRRIWKQEQVGSPYFVDDLIQMYEDQSGLCAYCETPLFGTYHVDHMIPLCRGGLDGWENLAITCPHCNHSKNAKTAEDICRTSPA